MRVIELDVCGKTGIMIYISRSEREENTIKAKIEDLKKLYKDVAVLISGTEPMEENIRKIVCLYS